MTNASHNPWINRFDDILDVDEIKQRANRLAHPLSSLDADTIEHACIRMKLELEEVFITTARAAEIIKKMIDCALSHSTLYYPDLTSFMRQCYAESKNCDANKSPYFPHILTGPAGTGKSKLGQAILRVFPQPSYIQPDEYHPKFPLITAKHISVDSRTKPTTLFKPLAPPATSNSLPDIEDCARWQYKCGTSLLIADELQYLALSDNASALAAGLLLRLSYLRLPILAIANYSLIHKLNKRKQEDTRRLLEKPLILLLPDPPSSPDWLAILKEYQSAVAEVYQFDFSKKCQELWSLCAGLKGYLVKLLVLAYSQCRRRKREIVLWTDIEVAYRSPDFFIHRSVIEVLISQSFGSTSGRNDLRCPIPTEDNQEEEYLQALREARQKKVNEAVIADSMSKAERTALKMCQDAEPEERPRIKSAVRPRRGSVSAEDLQKNSEKYMAQIKK